MSKLFKWLLLLGILFYLTFGEGAWPSTARTTWQALDQATNRHALSWTVRFHQHPTTAALADHLILWLWQSRDDHEKEVMRRYLILRGYTPR